MKKTIVCSMFLFVFMLFTGCSGENQASCTQKTYTITWKNYDGTVLEVDENVLVGEFPEYNGEEPVKEDQKEGIYDYKFVSWSPQLSSVKENVTYTAQFIETKKELSVEFSHESGFFNDSFNLILTTRADSDIYYTIDSTTPTKNSIKYSAPILIEDNSCQENIYSNIANISSCEVFMPTWVVDKAVVVRAVAYDKNENVYSAEVCKTYFLDYDNKEGYENLAVMSLVMDPEDLFDYEKGIYVTGKLYDENEHTGYPETYPANYQEKGKEWERPATMIYFNEDKNFDFDQNIGVRIHGGWSRSFNQKSFNLYARKEYSGTKTFKKSFFDTDTMQSCMLRSGGYRDTVITKTRDSLNQDLSKSEDFSIQDSYPCILFLNGEYWGIYNLQERFTEYYVEEHYGVDKDNVVIIENDEVDEGIDEDIELYQELINFFTNNNFVSSENYQKAKQFIDVNGFVQYVSTELYVGNIDWPGNNVRLWRARETSVKAYEDGKWRFMMYDTDDSSDIHNKCNVDSDPFLNISHWKYGPLDDRCVVGLIMTRLLENVDFKELFVDTFKRIGSENFSPYKVEKYLSDKCELLINPMKLYYKRFVSDNDEYSQEYFKSEIDKIVEYFNKRYSFAITFLEKNIL